MGLSRSQEEERALFSSEEELQDQTSLSVPNERARRHEQTERGEGYNVKLQREIIENEELTQNIKERKKYAEHIFWVLVVWLASILGILVLHCFRIEGLYLEMGGLYFEMKNLSDVVLVTLITTTTANIAAFFLVVIKYLFPNKIRY